MRIVDRPRWYEAEVFMADLTGHRHTMRGVHAWEIETRMRALYPEALTTLVRPEPRAELCLSVSNNEPNPDFLLLASFPPGPLFRCS